MTRDERQKLREAALLAMKNISLRSQTGPGSGEWSIWTSNSFRRISCYGDGDVLCAVTQRSDGHPDLLAPPGVLDYLVMAQPRVVLALLDYIDAIEKKLDRIEALDAELNDLRAIVEAMRYRLEDPT